MRIDYCSDLHLDNAMSGGPHGWLGSMNLSDWIAGGEVLVIAGDTAEHVDDTVDFLNAARNHYQTVIAVLGNHEAGLPSRTLASGVHVLDWAVSNRLVLGEVAFVGACLGPHDHCQSEAVAASIRETNQISPTMRIIGVSHYPSIEPPLPSLSSNRNVLAVKRFNFAEPPVNAWISGHLHREFDIKIGGVRHLSNPRGYRGNRRDGSHWSGFRTLDV